MGAPRLDGRWLAVALVAVAGCRCRAPVEQVRPAELAVEPSRLDFEATYVGSISRRTVDVTNQGGAAASVEVGASGPFASDVARLELPRGASATVSISFAPDAGGTASGALTLGEHQVPLTGTGLEVPQCVAAAVCTSSRFDLDAGVCVQAPASDGTACHTRCLSGACSAGTCVGSSLGCDDGDACTTDVCSEETGCDHLPRTCPAPAAATCKVAACDRATGCGEAVAPDGTVCGVDDCAALQVDVCISGQCVTRPRPATGRCANRWVPTTVPARTGHGMVFDAARQRVMLYGGKSLGSTGDETWEWDGVSWTELFPAASGPSVAYSALTYDSWRQRTVLFGGAMVFGAGSGLLGGVDGTYEWDGASWVPRPSAAAPPPLTAAALAYDPFRSRAVLFGGSGYFGAIDQTWEWDGASWVQRQPATKPSPRAGHSLAWDPVRRHVLLFGGANDAGRLSDETWTWDGVDWARLPVARSPPARARHAAATDDQRQRVVIFGGEGDGGVALSDTWEWDGQAWTQATPPVSPPAREQAAMAYDPVHAETVLFGGAASATANPWPDTWAWNGTTWTRRGPAGPPPPRSQFALTYDAARQKIVLFGGAAAPTPWPRGPALADTWEFDGTGWTDRAPATSPPPRSGHVLSYDEARQRVVLAGGAQPDGGPDPSTWEWDGTTWRVTATPTAPSGSVAAMAWDSASLRTMAISDVQAGPGPTPSISTESWAWDGASWTPADAGTSLPYGFWAMAGDSTRQNVVAVTSGYLYSRWGPETWLWEAGAWSQSAAVAPNGLHGLLGLADDRSRHRVVLFGTFSLLIWAEFPETWEWDGSAWTRLQPVTSPPVAFPGQSQGALAYDAARQRVTLFDGTNTWRWVP